MTPAPIRIDVWRGIRALLWTLVLPVSLAVSADWLAGSLPWLTIASALICIPLATIVVNRAVLAEFERVVDIVAPRDAEDLRDLPVPQAEQQDGIGQVLDVTAAGMSAPLGAADANRNTDSTPPSR